MNGLIPGRVISPIDGVSDTSAKTLVSESMCILHVDSNADVVVLIPIAARECQGRRYFRGPVRCEYSKLNPLLDPAQPQLVLRDMVLRPETLLTDEDLNKKYRRKGQQESASLTTLKLRWQMLSPLVDDADRQLLFDPEVRGALLAARAQEIVNDPTLRSALTSPTRRSKAKRGRVARVELAALKTRIEKELIRLINQFWAGGSIRGALITFSERCGGRGKPKKSGAAKRGAPNRKTEGGDDAHKGLNIAHDSDHAKWIKFSYDTWVILGTTVACALRRMWTEFYSVDVLQPDGSSKKEWLPWWQRPTRAQFDYWGTKESSGLAAWRRQLSPDQFDKSYRALIGSATDDVYGVGQRGAIDSTPPDIHLVRAIDRLARVGGAHRIIVVDSLFGFIPGLYMGFDPPSSTTVRLALYNALDPDKEAWLKSLSLDEIPADDFIPMWFSNLLADNTDLRTDEVMSCANGINTSIHFIPKRRSDRNPIAEAGHHTLHRMVDHRLLGTTFGRQTKRGEVPAPDRARYTMIEATRETVRAIHVHNTAEVEDNRPLRMRLNNVPPTRLAMTRECIRQGKIARAHQAIELARRHLLPRHAGTFTFDGVRLHRRGDTAKPEFIRHIAYVSIHPIVVQWCEEARRGGKHDPAYFRADFIVNPYSPSRIWYLDLSTGEVIELSLKVLKIRDPDLPYVMTLPDMVERDQVEGGEALDHKDARDRKIGGMEEAQRASNDCAEEAYQAAVAQAGGEPSKKAMRADRRANRDAEMGSAIDGIPVAASAATPNDAPASLDPKAHAAGEGEPSEAMTSAESPSSTSAGTSAQVVGRPSNSLFKAAIVALINKT